MRRRGVDPSEITIVKRRARRGQEEVHSGAWKVAFADFTLAMMALFMVLWIVMPQGDAVQEPAQPSPPREELILEGGAGIFDGVSRVPMEFEEFRLPIVTRQNLGGHYDAPEELRQLADLLRNVAAEVDALGNLEVQVVPQGLRILVKDDEQQFMFERGSSMLNPHFATLLGQLASVLANIDNKLIISGHTDATPFRTVGYDNWNLSGERALRARTVLVEAGLPSTAILQVAAQADVVPVRPEDPEHGANRRVEVLLLTRAAEALYRELFGESYPQVHYSSSGAKLLRPNGAQQ